MLKQLRLKDFLAPLIFVVILMPSAVFRMINRIKHRKLWLVAEEGEARDNGYHFYKYVREKHPEDYCFYAVKTSSAGYDKILKLGNTIKFGSLKHWLYYMAADLNISSQTSGNPSSFFWTFVHVNLGMYRNRVFLQHGVIKDDIRSLYYDRTKFRYFVTSTRAEYNEISNNCGYPCNSVILTGLPRWDNLKDTAQTQRQKSILIMPTWRSYLETKNNAFFSSKDFTKTDYYKNWNELLNDEGFVNYLERNNMVAYFYPHQHMQNKLKLFNPRSERVKLVAMREDISVYLSKCSIMITDYSSVAFDFAFLNKPVVYYQFDKKDYRSKQHREGYYSYERDGFGPICDTMKDIMKFLYNIGTDNTRYLERAEIFSDLPDRVNNSERVYTAIKKKKILHVISTLNNCGTEKYLINLLRHTHGIYDNVVLYYGGDNEWENELRSLGVTCIKSAGGNWRRAKTIWNVLRLQKIDVVYSYTYINSAFVICSALMAGVRMRITHSHRSAPDGKISKIKVIAARIVITLFSTDRLACSKDAGRSLYLTNNFKIINNGIELLDYRFNRNARESIRRRYRIEDDCVLLGTVGRIDKNKNQGFMVEVLRESIKLKKKCKLMIIGVGDEEKNLKKKVFNDPTLKDNVIFTESIKNANDYYNALDAFLLTSYREGFPYVLVEAQANGLPVFASSNIDEKAKINANFNFLDLDSGAAYWANEIEKMPMKRVVLNDAINDYSAENTALRIIEIYDGSRHG